MLEEQLESRTAREGSCLGKCFFSALRHLVHSVVIFSNICIYHSVTRKPVTKFNGAIQVKEYMEMLQEEDPTKYEAHFSKYLENGIDAEKMEEMYTEAHEKIREDPEGEKADKKDITYERDGDTMKASDGTEHPRSHKITLQQRREKVAAKIAAAQAKMMED